MAAGVGACATSKFPEHFEDNALSARHIQVFEPLGGALRKQPRLGLQRLRRLIFRFVLFANGYQSGSRHDHQQYRSHACDNCTKTVTADEFAQLVQSACWTSGDWLVV